MALEIQSGNLDHLETPAASILPTDAGVLSPELIKTLKLPEMVPLQQVMNFLSLQSSRLLSLQSSEPPYSTQAALPEPPSLEAMYPEANVMSDAEAARLHEARLTLQTASDDAEAFKSTVDQVLADLRKRLPGEGATPETGGAAWETGTSALDLYMVGQIRHLTEEREQEYRETIARMLKDPNVKDVEVIVTMFQYMTEGITQGMAKALKMFGQSVEEHETVMAKLELGEGKELTPTDMLAANEEMRRYGGDNQMWMQTMQSLQSDLQRTESLSKSMLSSVHEARLRVAINMT